MLTTMSPTKKRRQRKTKIERAAEERRTTPRQLLVDLYARFGNQSDIAEYLGVSQGTVSNEMKRHKLQLGLLSQDDSHGE